MSTREPVWFDGEGQMSLEADTPQADPTTDLVRRMTEAEINRQHKTTLVTGEPGTQEDLPISDGEIEDAVAKMPLIHYSDRLGVYMVSQRQVDLVMAATKLSYQRMVDLKPALQGAIADGHMQPRIFQAMTEGSQLGLFFIAAGHNWTPATLARQLIVEDAAAAGQRIAAENRDRL